VEPVIANHAGFVERDYFRKVDDFRLYVEALTRAGGSVCLLFRNHGVGTDCLVGGYVVAFMGDGFQEWPEMSF